MARRTVKGRRQRERALEPLPVRLPTAAAIRAALAREPQQAADRALLLARLQELGPVLPLVPARLLAPALELARERARELAPDPLARAVVKALLEQAPTIRRRGGKLPAPTGRKATRRS